MVLLLLVFFTYNPACLSLQWPPARIIHQQFFNNPPLVLSSSVLRYSHHLQPPTHSVHGGGQWTHGPARRGRQWTVDSGHVDQSDEVDSGQWTRGPVRRGRPGTGRAPPVTWVWVVVGDLQCLWGFNEVEGGGRRILFSLCWCELLVPLLPPLVAPSSSIRESSINNFQYPNLSDGFDNLHYQFLMSRELIQQTVTHLNHGKDFFWPNFEHVCRTVWVSKT